MSGSLFFEPRVLIVRSPGGSREHVVYIAAVSNCFVALEVSGDSGTFNCVGGLVVVHAHDQNRIGKASFGLAEYSRMTPETQVKIIIQLSV